MERNTIAFRVASCGYAFPVQMDGLPGYDRLFSFCS
jgi:hypothetical protein